jgi:hypothetical protein
MYYDHGNQISGHVTSSACLELQMAELGDFFSAELELGCLDPGTSRTIHLLHISFDRFDTHGLKVKLHIIYIISTYILCIYREIYAYTYSHR